MRIAITGSQGQLGQALQAALVADQLLPLDLPQHDITDLAAITATLRAFAPEMIVHTAAITDVDGCERNPDLAYRVHVVGTRNIAVAAQQAGCPLVHISTDYVFDGERTEPYWEYDAPRPLSVYANTKWAAEQVVRDHLTRFYIVRTAWMYGDGPRNFVKTVLRLAGERESLQMVTDEAGSPTYAGDLAAALDKLMRQPAYGIYHFTNAGVCSRYAWAAEILRLAGRADFHLIPSENYPRAARVPKHAELHNTLGAQLGITLRPWQDALAEYVDKLQHG